MRKIPTLFERDWDSNDKHVIDIPTPGCAWVLKPEIETIATFKWNGSAVMATRAGTLYKRRSVKPGQERPREFWQTGDPDPETGKAVGWVPADRDDPADARHWEAYDAFMASDQKGQRHGTFELVGPGVQGNPHKLEAVELKRHGDDTVPGVVEAAHHGYTGLLSWFLIPALGDGTVLLGDGSKVEGFEGIVFKTYPTNGPDREQRALYAKLKLSDFPKAADHG